jgi:protein-tyrosine phosphatase
MKAVYWIVPDLLAGRPGPAQVPWNLEELWVGGIRTIVSLVWGEGANIRAAGFRHYRAPLLGVLVSLPALQKWLVQRMLPVVDFVAAEVDAGRSTLVHCRAGKDRTGAVLAGYLIRHRGCSSEEATRWVRQANPRAMTAPGFARLPRLFESEI